MVLLIASRYGERNTVKQQNEGLSQAKPKENAAKPPRPLSYEMPMMFKGNPMSGPAPVAPVRRIILLVMANISALLLHAAGLIAPLTHLKARHQGWQFSYLQLSLPSFSPVACEWQVHALRPSFLACNCLQSWDCACRFRDC